jgi:CBS domain containing-hemolysin-like protein
MNRRTTSLLTVALWVSTLIALAVIVLSVLAAAMKRELNEFSRHESLGFLRLALVGAFGVVITQGLASLHLKWFWLTSLVLTITGLLLLGSQLLAKSLGHRKFGLVLAKFAKPLVRSIDLIFTPIASKPIEEPEEFEQEFMDSVEDFGETVVREIMVPRIDMVVIGSEKTLKDSLQKFMESGYSRLPVRGKNIDDLVGVLYLKDVARVFNEDSSRLERETSGSLARKPMFVPDSKPVEELLKEMQVNATHVAIAVDEYGGVAGLVTMEDVIEELVGEINDEYDRERPDIEQLAEDVLRVSAKSSLFELGEHIGLELEDDDIDSVGGLVTKLLGRLPRGGDQVQHSGLTFTAERFEGRDKRLVTILVKVDNAVLMFGEEE